MRNDLYGSHLLRAYELFNGSPRPHVTASRALPANILAAHETPAAKRNLAKIFCSKPCSYIELNIDDLADVYVSLNGQKRGKLSSTLSVLA